MIIGKSAAAEKLRSMVAVAGQKNTSVLLQGPTGAGKDVAARAIHEASERAHGPYVAVNCGGLPEHLVVSELFGFEKGAFTGALVRRAGKFEMANGGTLFLDEIGDMPLAAQATLLRVLETRQVERLGGGQPIPIDVQLVCATNRDLAADARSGRFRADLYYRINVLPIYVPPLRNRIEDIDPLLDFFLERHAHGDPPLFRESDRVLLRTHHWPGNVRELRNLVERACVLFAGAEVDLSQLQELSAEFDVGAAGEADALWDAAGCVTSELPRPAKTAAGAERTLTDGVERLSYLVEKQLAIVAKERTLADGVERLSPSGLADQLLGELGHIDMQEFMKAFEMALIDKAIARCNGSVSAAARALRTNRTTVIAKMRRSRESRTVV